MLNSGVLVLNRAFFPVHVTSVRRAFCLLYAGLARAVTPRYEMFDFKSWSELSASAGDDAVGLVGRMIRVPRVVVLTAYDRIPRRTVRFSRRNIFVRDRNTCQYCGRTHATAELNLDHVTPRSRGGGDELGEHRLQLPPLQQAEGGPPSRGGGDAPGRKARPAALVSPVRLFAPVSDP